MSLERYYRFHARIYDATRWSFLFGRKMILDRIEEPFDPLDVLEVGCGTGSNLKRLAARYRRARFVGIDLSPDMLTKAQEKLGDLDGRLTLVRGRFPTCVDPVARFDLILFSYSLSMFGADAGRAVAAVRELLRPEGIVAVVDFHDSSLPGFKRWMELNHVQVDAGLLAALESNFGVRSLSVRKAFLGAWSYFTFLGVRARSVATTFL